MFLVIAAALGSLHTYWALFASGPLDEDPTFVQIQQRRDARNRRIEERGLRGWIFDRHGDVAESLAGYRLSGDDMVRTYLMGESAVHIVGYFSLLRGSAGAELAYAPRLRSNLVDWNPFSNKDVVGEDVTLTLDRRLQDVAARQLGQTGKPGAVVVIQVPTGDVLAMASFPGFDPHRIDIDGVWTQLRGDSSQPFVNRALNQYYLPGSTFKLIVAASALEQGWTNPKFVCSAQGYRPTQTSQPIYDDQGPNEVHGRIGLAEALRVSCNQYFAQLGVKLGYQQLAKTAEHFGFHVDASPEQAKERRFDSELWGNREAPFRRVYSPAASRLVLSKHTSIVDIAFESYGQGYIQVTPLHLALVAGAIANGGQMMAARLDHLYEARPLRRVLSGAEASDLRAMMLAVTEHPGGTAFRAFSGLRAGGVHTAGKTGTAQFAIGQTSRVDSWFVGFAPADHPQICYAVVVEGGGYGSEAAAPIAAALVEAAERAHLLRPKENNGHHDAKTQSGE
jgi:cell division protein FtsI/penicillin-binding protein 2